MKRDLLIGVVALALASAASCGGTTDTGGSGGSTSSGGATGGSTSSGTGGGTSSGTGGSTSSGTGGAASLPEQYCEGNIARDLACGNLPEPTMEQCLADSQCMFDVVRPAIIEELVDCLNTRPCGTSDDGCFYDVGAADPIVGQEQFGSDCLAKDAACPPADVKDDYCFVTFGTTELFSALAACLNLACDQVTDCFAAAFPPSCQG